MAGLVNPLVEKPFQVLARGRFHRLPEIIALDDLKLVCGHIRADALPPGGLAQQPPQRVQHARPFGIRHAVEHIVRVFVLRLDNRAAIALIAVEIRVERSLHFEPEYIVAAVVFGEERSEIRGETLVEPDVRPVLAGQKVAEPLVCQLVRDEAVFIMLEAGDLIVKGSRSWSWR